MRRCPALVMMAGLALTPLLCAGADLDAIGVTLLRTITANLDGAGVRVVQAEGQVNGTNQPPAFEVNPNATEVLQPLSLFTYHSALGSSSNYPNTFGLVSTHANLVAANFFGLPAGVATNLAHVDNSYADYFYDTYVDVPFPPNPDARIVNQSWIFEEADLETQQAIDSAYDDAAARHNTLFVSGAGNGGPVNPPSTCYNGLSVGAYGGSSSVGPTPDNGRCKPDLIAPAAYTSYSTPQVAGAAALLVQAGARGDGGADTNAATDLRTLKALLLNGAVKPANWANSISSPLDARYGAGILNVFNSYRQLAFGRHAAIEQTSVNQGDSHPPGNASENIISLSGWDYADLSSTPSSDFVNHYYFDVTNQLGNAPFTATATLVWNRQETRSAVNDLDLFLYDLDTGSLVEQSISAVDNVEQLYLVSLPPGRYDLQVVKYGGSPATGRITAGETYALAWEFFNLGLEITLTNSTVVLTWPIYPAGFKLESASSLTPPASWAPVAATPLITGQSNGLELPIGASNAYFRLRRP